MIGCEVYVLPLLIGTGGRSKMRNEDSSSVTVVDRTAFCATAVIQTIKVIKERSRSICIIAEELAPIRPSHLRIEG